MAFLAGFTCEQNDMFDFSKNSAPDYIIEVTSVTLSTPPTIMVGSTGQLTAVIEPLDATYTTLTWTTSDNAVAEVDDSGLVTGLSKAQVTITATAHNGVKGTRTFSIM